MMFMRGSGGRSAHATARPSWPVYRRLLRFARPYAGRLLVAAGLLLHRGLYQRLYERTFEHRETVAAS